MVDVSLSGRRHRSSQNLSQITGKRKERCQMLTDGMPCVTPTVGECTIGILPQIARCAHCLGIPPQIPSAGGSTIGDMDQTTQHGNGRSDERYCKARTWQLLTLFFLIHNHEEQLNLLPKVPVSLTLGKKGILHGHLNKGYGWYHFH